MANAKLLIVADDFTGGLDTGAQFARQGISVRVVTNPDKSETWARTDCRVLVAVTETRHMTPEAAGEAVRGVVAAARRAGIPYVYKKTDSALRGNIGAELAAALSACEADMLPFLPAFPRMGRTTRAGRHYIEGVPVSESVFARDPFNPVRESDVCRLIAAQTDTPAWSAAPKGIVPGRGICVVDAESDADLEAAGERLRDMGALSVSAGCAGFAACLPPLLGMETGPSPALPRLGQGLLVVCGSVNPITRRQLDLAEAEGFARVRLSPGQKLDPDRAAESLGRLPEDRWLILDANDPDPENAATLAYARDRGWGLDEVRRRITASLAEMLGAQASEGQRALLITGGDTLLACLARLGGRGLEPLAELFPGVVLSKCAANGRERLIISKSGGFGEETLLTDLRRLIERQKEPQ